MKRPSFLIWTNQSRMLAHTGAASLLLFFVTVGFSLFLSATILRQYTTEAILDGYGTAAGQLQTLINRGLNFGRPLHGFVGLQEHLKRTRDLFPGIENIAVYDADDVLVASVVPPESTPAVLQKAPTLYRTAWKREGNHHLLLPLGGKGDTDKGVMVFTVSPEWSERPFIRYFHDMALLLLFLGPLICMAKLGWFAYLSMGEHDSGRFLALLRRSVLVFIGGGQALFVGIAVLVFMGELRSAVDFSAELSGKFMAGNLELLVHKNLRIQHFPGLQAHMEALLKESPGLGGIRLYAGGDIVTQAGTGFQNSVNVPVYQYWTDANTARTQIATVAMYPDERYQQTIIRQMLVDQFTALILSFVMLLQLSGLLAAHVLSQQDLADTEGLVEKAHDTMRLNTFFFLFFCAYDFVMSFIPLVAAQLPSGVFPLSPSLHNGLPISAEATFATIAVITSGMLNRRLGWKRMLYLAIGAGLLGALLAFLATDIALFILSRACSGFGMGMMLMAGQFCVIEQADNRLEGLAGIYAALFAGSICGSASGGILYDIFSPPTLFALSGLLMILPLLLRLPSAQGRLPAENPASAGGGTSWKRFLTPSFVLPILLVSVPAGMTLTGFLYLSFPTVMKALHFEQADIGRLFMLYGFCFVFIGPYLAKIAKKSSSQTPFVALTGIAGGSAILAASLLPTFWGFALAALLMGVSQCLLSSSLLVYVLSLPAMRSLEGPLVSTVCRMCERTGQILGPLLFGVALVHGTMLPVLGLCCLSGALLFWVFPKK